MKRAPEVTRSGALEVKIDDACGSGSSEAAFYPRFENVSMQNNRGFEVRLEGRTSARRNVQWRPDKNGAMALWRTWVREKKAGDRITVKNLETGNFEVIENV